MTTRKARHLGTGIVVFDTKKKREGIVIYNAFHSVRIHWKDTQNAENIDHDKMTDVEVGSQNSFCLGESTADALRKRHEERIDEERDAWDQWLDRAGGGR